MNEIDKYYGMTLSNVYFEILGIYKNTVPYQTYIDVNGIAELKKTNVNDNEITLGKPVAKINYNFLINIIIFMLVLNKLLLHYHFIQ